MRNKVVLFFFLIFSTVSFSQSDVLNTNPPSVKWKRIDTENFRVIFPDNFENEAQRVANTLEAIHDPETKTLGVKPKRIDLILQNQNSIANGFVALGPRRSEFFTSAPQDYNFLGSGEWLTLLATHEYRHIVQYASSNVGITRVAKFLFGQYTQAAFANLAVPQWFWEGDATAIETAYTASGRGRLPNFDRTFRANLLEGRRYHYDKQHLRSFKDFVPNHYVFGYHFVTHLRRKTNEGTIWEDVTNRSFKYSLLPYGFSSSLKKFSGRNLIQNYGDMLNELEDLWSNQVSKLSLTPFSVVNQRKNTTYTDYSYPVSLADGSVLCLRQGMGNIPQFIVIDEYGAEKVIHTPGNINNSGTISLSDNLLAWNEFRYNPRYPNQSYSVIEMLNTNLKSNQKLTSQTRYHSAAISHDKSKVVTIEAKQDGTYQIVVIDAFHGKEIKRFESEANTFYNNPTWSPDDQQIVAMKTNKLGKSVVSIDYHTGQFQELIPPSFEVIGNVFIYDDYLFYHSPYSGIDNVYAMNLVSGEHYQVTCSKYGAYNASISYDEKSIYYNDHQVNGLDIAKIPFDPSTWIPVTNVKVDKVEYYQPIVEQEGGEHIVDNISPERYASKKHNSFKGLINPHSWGPLLTSNINEIEAGVMSQNVLSTTSLYAGLVYDAVEQTTFGVGRFSYQGLWPIIDVEATRGQRTTLDFSSWMETSLEAGLRVPLTLTSGKFRQSAVVSNNVGVRQVQNYQREGLSSSDRFIAQQAKIDTVDSNGNVIGTSYHDVYSLNSSELENGEMLFNHFELSYRTMLKMNARDIYPKYGLSVNFENYNTLKSDFSGRLSAINARVFLPSLFKHHSIYVIASAQTRKIDANLNLYTFQNRIFRPRGYSYYTDASMKSVRFNYALPVWCPDIAVGPLVYVKRFKLNAFYDIGRSTVPVHQYLQSDLSLFRQFPVDIDYKSLGAELTMDFNVLRLPYDMEIGVRFVYAGANSRTSAATNFELMIAGIGF